KKKDKSTQTAAADPPADAADPPASVAPVTLPAPGTGGPASTQLLADLTARYGPGQGVSTAATAPSLLEPSSKNKPSLLRDRAAGGGAGMPGGGGGGPMVPLGGY